MIHALHEKNVLVTPPAALLDNASAATTTIDTIGYDYCKISCLVGATDIAMTALKVQESDDSGMSGAADIDGTVFGTDNNTGGSASTLPSATDDNKIFTFYIDLRGRKRYLDLVATFGDGTVGGYFAAMATLSRGEIMPSTAALRGNSQDIVV